MEASAYETFAQLEDSHFWFVSRRRIFFDLLDRAVGERGDLRILEVGCGAGGMLGPLSRYGRVHGLDIAHDYIAYCKHRGFDRVLTGSGYELPFADQSFDLVALFDTIEHIPNDQRVLQEVGRVLRPGGLVFVSVPAYQFLFSQNDRIAHHCRRYTARRLGRLIRGAGFELRKLTYFNTLLFPLILPTVLLQKVLDRFWRLPEGFNNTSLRIPGPLNRLFTWTMSGERFFLRRMRFPFGHSLIALARK